MLKKIKPLSIKRQKNTPEKDILDALTQLKIIVLILLTVLSKPRVRQEKLMLGLGLVIIAAF